MPGSPSRAGAARWRRRPAPPRSRAPSIAERVASIVAPYRWPPALGGNRPTVGRSAHPVNRQPAPNGVGRTAKLRAVRLVTWNVNSIRQRLPRLLALLARHEPDVVCLQETKVADADFPIEPLLAAGYAALSHGQGGRNGVAIVSRLPLEEVARGMPATRRPATPGCSPPGRATHGREHLRRERQGGRRPRVRGQARLVRRPARLGPRLDRARPEPRCSPATST